MCRYPRIGSWRYGSSHCRSHRAAIPTISVLGELLTKYATTAARDAAATLGIDQVMAPAGLTSATIGSTSAVSIAAGTYLSARASSGGIERLAKNAMNDRREK